VKRAIDAAGQWLLVGIVAGALLGVPTAHNLLSAGPPVSPGEIGDAAIVEGTAAGSAPITRAADGMFYATARIEGVEHRCLVDSGASGLMLGARDARRLLPTRTLRFDGRLITAGGSRAAAHIRVASLGIAGHELRDVPAIVAKGGHVPCLLGQQVLARLDAVELSGNRLTLR
jgi:aspartyl protease family protein